MHFRLSILCMCLAATLVGCTSTSVPQLAADESDDTAVAGYRSECTEPGAEPELSDRVLELVNEVRLAEGLEPLTTNDTLREVAESYACEMVDEGFFAHENPVTGMGPGERLTASGYIYYSMGENLAVGQVTPEEVVDAWMDSPRHRLNILADDWREVGIAVRNGGAYGWYWVQEFADPVDFGPEDAEDDLLGSAATLSADDSIESLLAGDVAE